MSTSRAGGSGGRLAVLLTAVVVASCSAGSADRRHSEPPTRPADVCTGSDDSRPSELVESFPGRVVALVGGGWNQVMYGCRIDRLNGPAMDEVFFGYSRARLGEYSPLIIVYSAVDGELEPRHHLLVDAYVNAAGADNFHGFPRVPAGLPRQQLSAMAGYGRALLVGPLLLRADVNQGNPESKAWLLVLRSRRLGEAAVGAWGVSRGELLSVVHQLRRADGSAQVTDWMDRQAERQREVMS
jgi:hypothetical protein